MSTTNTENVAARAEGRNRLNVPQQSQESRSSSSTSLHTNVDRTSTVPPRGRPLVRAPSHLRRSTSLNGLDDEDDNESHESVHSLPQPVTRINQDSNDVGRGRSFLHPKIPFESAPASLASVRQVVTILKPLFRHPSPSALMSLLTSSSNLTMSSPPIPAIHRITHEDSPSRNGRRHSPDSHLSPTRNSPLRRFWPLGRTHSREEPFQPRDPYQFRIHVFSCSSEEMEHSQAILSSFLAQVREIVVQVYRYCLLRVPSMYFTRVSRIFEEAEVSRPDIERMIQGCAMGLDFPHEWAPPQVSPALSRFKISWEDFIDSVIREWKTLNVVSALLLSAILTVFQIGDAAVQPIIRSAALISLICASWALIYGGVYIMRFSAMRSMYKASSWAREAQRSKTGIFWNVWVLLSLPAVWVGWSMIAFFVAIISFVWTTGSSTDNPQAPTPRVELIPRIIITAIFVLGLIYFGLIIYTFKNYGAKRPRIEVSLQLGPIQLPDLRTVPATATGNALDLTGVENGDVGDRRRTSISSTKDDLEKGVSVLDERGRRVSPRL